MANEIKYGYWRTVETSYEWLDDFCSECGYMESAFSGKKICPKCGAVMVRYDEWEQRKGIECDAERMNDET